MKKLLMSTMAIVSFLCFACQPKDDKLQRQPITNGTGAQQSSTSSDMNSQEINQLLALNFDRIAEAIHILKASVNPEYASKYNIVALGNNNRQSVITKDLNNRVDLSDLRVVSTKNETNTKDKAPTTKNANLNLNVRRLLTDENGTVIQFVAVKEIPEEIRNAGYVYDGKKNPVDFSSITQTESLSIQQVEPGLYAVTVSRGEDVSSKKDSNSLMITRLAFDFSWSGKIVDLDVVNKVTLKSLNISRKGNKRGFINLMAAGPAENEIGLKLDECASLNGAVKVFIAQPKQNGKDVAPLVRTVRLVDSTLKIDEEAAFESKAIMCSGRPVVDLTRML